MSKQKGNPRLFGIVRLIQILCNTWICLSSLFWWSSKIWRLTIISHCKVCCNLFLHNYCKFTTSLTSFIIFSLPAIWLLYKIWLANSTLLIKIPCTLNDIFFLENICNRLDILPIILSNSCFSSISSQTKLKLFDREQPK